MVTYVCPLWNSVYFFILFFWSVIPFKFVEDFYMYIWCNKFFYSNTLSPYLSVLIYKPPMWIRWLYGFVVLHWVFGTAEPHDKAYTCWKHFQQSNVACRPIMTGFSNAMLASEIDNRSGSSLTRIKHWQYALIRWQPHWPTAGSDGEKQGEKTAYIPLPSEEIAVSKMPLEPTEVPLEKKTVAPDVI